MRRAGALAAATFLVIALGAAGCDWIGSLTPFGIGHQDYGAGDANLNGDWAGKTASGGDVKFQIGDNAVSEFVFYHIEGACTLTFEFPPGARVVDGVFTTEVALTQGRCVVTVSFPTADTGSGTYFFEGLPTGDCPSAGSGTFVADKTTL